MFSDFDPQEGNLVISEPFMMDDNFVRSVILLCMHDETKGTMGLITNRDSNTFLGLKVRGEETRDFPIYIGGPMEHETLWYIHQAGDRISGGKLIYDNLYFGGNFQQIQDLVNEEKLLWNEIKFFKGYTSWAPNQLVEEIQENSWAVHNYYFSNMLFIYDGDEMWKEALVDLGPKYAHVAKFPKSSEIAQN